MADPVRLIALGGVPPRVQVGDAEAASQRLYGLSSSATRLDGERDANFRLETPEGPRLLKFIDHEMNELMASGQCAVLTHLAEVAPELPVPRIIPTRDGRPLGTATVASGTCPVMLVTWLPGSHLASVLHADPGRTDRCSPALLHSVGTTIARLDRALRGFFSPALSQQIAWDARQLPQLMTHLSLVSAPDLRELVRAVGASMPDCLRRLRYLRAQAIHGDCHPRNVLVNEAVGACAGIVDFGDMIHGPVALELAVAMSELLSWGAPLESLSDLLSGYAQEAPLEAEDIEALYPLVRARVAVGVLIHAWRARHSPTVAGGTGDPANAPDRPATSAPDRQAANAPDRQAANSPDRRAATVLEQLAEIGPKALTDQLKIACGVTARPAPLAPGIPGPPPPSLLQRRHSALGSHAELSYDTPVHLVRGEGVWLYTAKGEPLLDVYNNVPHVGHANPAVVAAIAQQAARIASNTRYLDERIIEYVERLRSTLPPDLDTCLFVNSGSEANDIAWRIAKSHTGQEGALVMMNAYHGITDAVTALSPSIWGKQGAPHVEQLAPPGAGADGVDRAVFRLRERGFRPACLMIDSALTSSGIFDPPPSWAAQICAPVRASGALVIADEVQIGLGRSGSHFWGFARRGLSPDILTLGKPVGNGYPLGVVVTRQSLLEEFQQATGFFSTFGGNPVAAAAGLAVLDVLEKERLQDNARQTGEYFLARLRDLRGRHVGIEDVRGTGLMIGVELADPPDRTARQATRAVVNGLRNRGVLIGSEGPRGNVLKLRPPMPFHKEHVDLVIEALDAVLPILSQRLANP